MLQNEEKSIVLCYFTNTLCAVLTVICPINITGNPKENTRSGAPLERGRTVYLENDQWILWIWGVAKSKDPTPPQTQESVGVYFRKTPKRPLPCAFCLTRRLAEARKELYLGIWPRRPGRPAGDARRLLSGGTAYVALLRLADCSGENNVET